MPLWVMCLILALFLVGTGLVKFAKGEKGSLLFMFAGLACGFAMLITLSISTSH